jgi:glycosyltransferase A (GT-A) superfamily protein (DUF2064 family)
VAFPREGRQIPSKMMSTSEPVGTTRETVGRLLVFTLGPRSEARRHPLLPERFRDAEVELRQACLESVIDAASEAGLRVELCSPRSLALDGVAAWQPQEGSTFGDRYRRALRTAFASAPGSPLVVVGSDSPGLGARQLVQAIRALEVDPERVVLGPSRDGGFYLLAAARPLDHLLGTVAWCGRATRRTLLDALARAGRPVVMLAPLGDLDAPRDLVGFLAEATAARLPRLSSTTRLLRRLLQDLCRPFSPLIDPGSPERLQGRCLGRAPPFLLAH